MRESVDYKKQVTWFTSLVSKKESLRALKKQLELIDVADSTIVNMTQGNKVSRFIAWRY
jgi:23S rRNA (adenine1618-N6)-methyltransferase